MLRSLVENRRTAVKASHAIGKTFVAAVAACWWFDCWDEHIVYVTGPTWEQALNRTFKEITRIRRARRLPGQILETGLIRDPDRAKAGAHYIKALNAETGEGFQGEHTSEILIILEEAVGVPAYIWPATGGLMTAAANRLLAIANPTAEDNPFGAACAAGSGYAVITVDALTHPNVNAELHCQPLPVPNAVELTWLQEMLEVECEAVEEASGDTFEFWGLPAIKGALTGTPVAEEAERWHYLPNAAFQGRVLGQFPSQADEQVIPRGWLANLRPLQVGTQIELGVDVARKGTDRTAIAARSGPCLIYLAEVRQFDLSKVVGAIILAAKRLTEEGGNAKTMPIRVDVTGGMGAGPADRLRELGYRAIDVNSSAKAIESEQYRNKRSELWFVVRERARTRDLDLSMIDPLMREKLERELSTPTWDPNSRGQKVVEDKAETKKRLGASPDLADAVNLAFDATGGSWDDNEIPDEEIEEYKSDTARQTGGFNNW